MPEALPMPEASPMPDASPLVSVDWLKDRLEQPGIHQPDIAIIDASWYLPQHQRDARGDYAAGHIPEAVFFDIDLHADRTSPLPHMLPPPEVFAEAAGSLGISDSSTIVVYDGLGLFSAPRVWWMFKVFGAEDVRVLDGGYPAWLARGFATTDTPASPRRRDFQVAMRTDLVADMQMMTTAIAGGLQIADARPPGRFSGRDPEIRPGIPSGHMPGARNIPQSSLVRDGHLLKGSELAQALTASGIDIDRPLIATCGSGVSAATITLALAELGRPMGRLYDGSWTEWGGTKHNAIERSDGSS